MNDRWQTPAPNQTSFLDVLMNGLGAFIVLFLLSLVLVRPEAKTSVEQSGFVEGKYRISISWPAQSDDDVDLYVRDPAGNIAYFESREVGLMHLEHDNRGRQSETPVDLQGQAPVLEKNEEHIILRGTIPGEYVVNVHLYRMTSAAPVTVTIALRRSNDNRVMKSRMVTLARGGDEKTAFRFTVDEAGVITTTNELEVNLTKARRSQEQQFLNPGAN